MIIDDIGALFSHASVVIILISLAVSVLITLFTSLLIKEFSIGHVFTSKLLNHNLDVLFVPALYFCCFLFLVKMATVIA